MQLKSGKSAGHDLLQPEHLKHGGEALKIWIQQVCNAIVELESVPNSLKLGIVTPIYKGGGKDPLDTNSYRGITLTPMLAKVFESLILNPRCAAGKRDTSSKPNGLPEESFMCGGHLLNHGSCLAICPAGKRMYICFMTSKKPLIQCNILSFSSTYTRLVLMEKPGG